MKISKILKQVVAPVLFIGALPFLFSARAYAGEEKSEATPPKAENKWLDDYSKPVGLTYNAEAKLQTTYLWRGLYCGGANIQGSADVGYGGLYLEMWWNIGVTDWAFKRFQPELDLSLGFSRWGLDVYLLYVHNFNCGFFDFNNYADKGNRLEVNVRYVVSSKLPLGVHWGTRVSAADGYLNAAGEVVRAWSSYAAIFYTQKLPYDLSLYGEIGITPWKSRYTNFQGDFAVNNITIRLRKDWSVSKHCGLMLMGQLTINPYLAAADKSSVEWHSFDPSRQSVNVNVGFGAYLK